MDLVQTSLPKVEFLIAGVQKGGTTALHSFLSQHPRIYLPAYKEVHFFDDELQEWQQPDYSQFHSHFSARQKGQIAGEATPIYSYWEPSALRIQKYNPEIKLVFLLRNPVERAYSHWAMEFGRGTETVDFATAIHGGRSRLVLGQHRIFSYVERGFYSAQIDRFTALFPSTQLLFLKTEDLAERQENTLDLVCDLVGVEPFADYPPARRVLPHEPTKLPSPTTRDSAYLRDLFRDDIERTQHLTGLDLAAWLQ